MVETVLTTKNILRVAVEKWNKKVDRWFGAQVLNGFCGMIMGALNGFLSLSIGSAIAKI